MLHWFRKKKTTPAPPPLTTDLHSHLLAGIDDGVQSLEQSEEIIRYFQQLGYNRFITSPHVMSDAYRNSSEGILAKLAELREHLAQKNIAVTVDAAAEYYLDEAVMAMLETGKPMLTFGKRYLLFETNFLIEPLNLKEFIFLATSAGYKPVLAHPERYLYLQQQWDKLEDLLHRGVLFQVNISSVTGYYSKSAQVTAHRLIDNGWIHFLGSDCHNLQHVKLVEAAQHMKYYQKALSLPLLNNTL